MGYAKGIRQGHAGGHLREPALEIVDALERPDCEWWSAATYDGQPFGSAEAVYDHLGRLWHCTDVVPGFYRTSVEIVTGRTVGTYAQLARAVRTYLVDNRLVGAGA